MTYSAPANTTMTGPLPSRRHPEWVAHSMRWRWLLDSWEGGEAYRTAVYGIDSRGQPIHNLIRHKREYPDTTTNVTNATNVGWYAPMGVDPYYNATDDDYTLRLARTPVPTLVAGAVDTHLGGIFAREVDRDTADAGLAAWWADVDGNGTTVDQWVTDVVAPLLVVLGCLDVIVDYPAAPKGEVVETKADQLRLKLDRVVASVVLPENVVWWELDSQGRYVEALVCELQEDGSRLYRHWTAADWSLYRENAGSPVETQPHPFGRVPMVRLFDGKRPRFRHVGKPRYESTAENQREYYNRDSELILSDTTQAHPLLQGPEDYVQADGTIPVGPTWLLPKKKNSTGGAATYEGFDVVEFPKGGAESIRHNKADIRDAVDRDNLLVKPAGAAGTSGRTVAQTGVAKRLDSVAGNNLLGKIAGVLQKAETAITALVLFALGTPDADFTITYPKSFDLMTADEFGTALGEFQLTLEKAGALPETEEGLLCHYFRLLLPGLDDEDYQASDAEIQAYLTSKAADRARTLEGVMSPAGTGQESLYGIAPGTGTGTGRSDAGPDAAPDDTLGQPVAAP